MSEISLNDTTETEAAPEVPSEAPSGFLSSLPEDLRDNPGLKDFKDVTGLAKSYVNAQQMLGNSVRIPGEDASTEARNEFLDKIAGIDGVIRAPNTEDAEAMNSFYNALGRPEEASGYKIDMPEGVPINEQARDDFLKVAHELGLSNGQVQKLAQYEMKIMEGNQDLQVAARDKAAETLREQWGHDYSNRLAGAKSVAQIYSDKYPDAMKEILEGPMANNPAVISMMSELAKTLSESGHAGASSVPKYGISAEEARVQIAEIQGNKNHAYWNGRDSGHKAAVEKVHKLSQIAYSQ